LKIYAKIKEVHDPEIKKPEIKKPEIKRFYPKTIRANC
jgi:hypothetical protein